MSMCFWVFVNREKSWTQRFWTDNCSYPGHEPWVSGKKERKNFYRGIIFTYTTHFCNFLEFLQLLLCITLVIKDINKSISHSF